MKVLKIFGAIIALIVMFAGVIWGVKFIMNSVGSAHSDLDKKVLKPTLDAISNYVTQHDIPRKLNDIPNLPYTLEECSVNIEYKKMMNDTLVTSSVVDATDVIKIEKCSLWSKKISLVATEKSSLIHQKERYTIEMKNNVSKTTSHLSLKKDRDHFVIDAPLQKN